MIRKSLTNNFFYSAVTAILFSLSVTPFNQWYLAYFAFIPLLYSTYNAKLKNIIPLYSIVGFIISVAWGYSVIAYSWLNFLLLISTVCLSFIIWGLLNHYLLQRFNKKSFLFFFAPALIWTGIERLQTSIYIGIPGNLGITQSNQPELIQLTSIFGIYAVSFFIICINCLIAHSLYLYKNTDKNTFSTFSGIFLALTFYALNFLYGQHIIANSNESKDLKIAIIQPAISSETYRNSRRNIDDRAHIKNTLHSLSTEALTHDIDILFWPEGGDGRINMRLKNNINNLFYLAKNSNTDLLISADDINPNGEKFNSVFLISSNGIYSGRYDKVHLIPGAEDSYTPGKKHNNITSTYGEIGIAICFESIFSKILRNSTAQGAEILFASTSDATFKNTSLPLNHTNLSVFRALENNRWLVHASNTGPSMVVSPKGVITTKATMYEREIVYANINKTQEQSVFVQWGYIIPMILSVFTILLLATFLANVILLNPIKAIQNKTKYLLTNHITFIKQFVRLKYSYYLITLAIITLSLVATSIYTVNLPIKNSESVVSTLNGLLQPVVKHKDTLSTQFLQKQTNTCGPAALSYLLNHYGLSVNEKEISKHISLSKFGTSMLELKRAVSIFGFNAKGYKGNYSWLKQQNLPLIAYINDNHYVVINKISDDKLFMFDPGKGHVIIKRASFEKAWRGYSLTINTQPIRKSLE